MALSNDQKAMLKLVAQPDTSYEDIAALMGLSVAEVRAKVDAALAELDQASPSAPAAEEKPPEPPPPPPKEPPKPKPDPDPPGRRADKSTQDANIGPSAEANRRSAGKPRIKLPDDRGARYALFAGVAVVIVLVLLLVTGVLGGGDDSTEPASVAESGTVEGGGGQATPTQALLKEVDGSGVSGRAVFGRAGKSVALAVRVTGLDQPPANHFYVISLAKASGEQAPLVVSSPNKSNEIVGNFKIKPQNLGYLGIGYTEMNVTLVATKELAASIKSAQKSKTGLEFSGTTVASGEVVGPVIEIAEKTLEKEKEGG